MNIRRRHLNAEQKRDLITKLLKVTPEKSNNSIAKTIGVDDKTVGTVRDKLETTSKNREVDKDGRRRWQGAAGDEGAKQGEGRYPES